MSNAPAVSVVVPVFNAATTIEYSLQSLLSQSLTDDLEIIVVDDASTDGSREIVEQLSKTTNRIVRVNLQTNQGVHEARLAGIKRSRAPWIGFLDADDAAKPDMFKRLLEEGDASQADIVVCGSWRVNEAGKRLAPKLRFNRNETISLNIFDRFSRFEFGTGMLWNKLYRRDIILPYADLHFAWRQNINEDLILNIGCFYQANKVRLLKDMLHEYSLRGSSVTTTIQKARAYVDTYRAYALAVHAFAHLGKTVLQRIADMYRVQLGWGAYQVDNISELDDYLQPLNEATELLCQTSPEAIGLIISRAEPPPASARRMVFQISRKFISLLRV